MAAASSERCDCARTHPALRALPPAGPRTDLQLRFDAEEVGDDRRLRDLIENFSALAVDGDGLWIGGDEFGDVDYLSRQGRDAYAAHERLSLAAPFDLPEDAEIDLEGLSLDGAHLWILGSHCLTRRKLATAWKKAETPLQALERMTLRSRSRERYRCFLGRLDLGAWRRTFATGSLGAASRLKIRRSGDALIDLLRKDKQLKPFLTLPAKENGLDLEGLAARGETVFLGLRGPVIGGLALILELRAGVTRKGALELRDVAGGRRLVKHALDLQGLGIRDLVFDGEDLLILAGPTLPIPGATALFRWRVGGRWRKGGVVCACAFEPLLLLPPGESGAAAEGIALDGATLLVVYDRRGVGDRATSTLGKLAAFEAALPRATA